MNPEILEYVLRNRGTYTDDSIREALRKVGYPASEIDEVLAIPDLDPLVAERRAAQAAARSRVTRIVLAIYLVLLVLLGALTLAAFSPYATIGLIILVPTLAIALAISVVVARPIAANRVGEGIAAALVLPIVLALVIAGPCVVFTIPALTGR